MLRVEDLPEGELEAMERSPDEVVLSSVGHGEDLRLADLRGQTSVLVFEGVQSMRSEQGKEVNRALNRWVLPEGTHGYIVWDGEGMRVFGEDYLPGLDGAIRSSTRAVTVHGPGARSEARIGDPDFFVELRVPGSGSLEAAGP